MVPDCWEAVPIAEEAVDIIWSTVVVDVDYDYNDVNDEIAVDTTEEVVLAYVTEDEVKAFELEPTVDVDTTDVVLDI